MTDLRLKDWNGQVGAKCNFLYDVIEDIDPMDASLQFLFGPNIEYLRGFTDSLLLQIAGSEGLRVVNLCGMALTSLGMRVIRQFPCLESLNLAECNLNDDTFKELYGHQHVEELLIFANQLTDDSVPTLASLPKLASLDLGAISPTTNCITPAGLETIARIPTLRKICVYVADGDRDLRASYSETLMKLNSRLKLTPSL